MLSGLKQCIKRLAQRNRHAKCALDYVLKRRAALRVISIHTWHDLKAEAKHIGWKRKDGEYWKLSSELIFWYHKIEKGLSLPTPRDVFGLAAVERTCALIEEWDRSALERTHPIYVAAIEALHAYIRHVSDHNLSKNVEAQELMKRARDITTRYEPTSDYFTPVQPVPPPFGSFDILHQLSLSRRSVRNYCAELVDQQLIVNAIQVAQLAPSACNRQPWHVHLYDDRACIEDILDLQLGGKGFGEHPLLAVLTSDYSTFFDLSERNELSLDAGLFLMLFILALQAQGLSTCCLNWCVSPDIDIKGHEVTGIATNEKIICCLAIGKAQPLCVVPRSVRRPLNDVLVKHTRT